jgi:hypothetical protein
MRKLLSEVAPVLIAAFFLVVPVGVLVRAAWKQRDPAQDYMRAVHEAMVPDHISHWLVSAKDLENPVTVVTWKQQSDVEYYKGKEVGKDTWVTVVPNLRSFCQDFVKSHGSDPAQLELRLRQRLGLPLKGNYDSFVEFKVDPKTLFRPCNALTGDDPCAPISSQELDAIRADFKNPVSEQDKQTLTSGNNANGSSPGAAKADLDPTTKQKAGWLLAKYYESYSSSPAYPWTSLGYTFDWAPKEDGSDDFARFGESEFVVRAKTPIIQFVSAPDTAAYCAPE